LTPLEIFLYITAGIAVWYIGLTAYEISRVIWRRGKKSWKRHLEEEYRATFGTTGDP
jgi:hypothetical protein